MNPYTPPHAPQQPAGGVLIAGPWPSCIGFLHLPERDRWELYSSAKAYRASLEDQGFQMAEPYDQFIRRVTGELEL